MFRSGSGAGIIIGSLFKWPGQSESNEFISNEMASLPELGIKILQLISKLLVMLCWSTGYSDDKVDKVDILSILPV